MPLYEYTCKNCKKNLELIRKVSEADNKVCPECKKEELERKVSGSSFQLKGSGWFKDGY
jgi:putative FmdB family regulatory protein